MLSKSNDCKSLFKKQALQYQIALRESKARKKKTALSQSTSPRHKTKTTANRTCTKVIDQTIPPISNSPHFELPMGMVHVSAGASAIIPNNLTVEGSKRLEKFQLIKVVQQKINNEKTIPMRNFSLTGLPVAWVGVSGLAGMALLGLFQRRAQQLSRWANGNPWKTRGLIGISQIAMGSASLWLGDYLYDDGIMIPEYARLVSIAAFATAAIFYPSTFHKNGSPAFSYLQRKFHDAALFTTGAMLTVYAGNHYNITIHSAEPASQVASVSAPAENMLSVKFVKSKISLVKRKFQKRLVNYLDKPKQLTEGDKIALTILASIGFALLTVAVAAASCNLSCAGNEGAAVAVLIGGAALIAWGLSTALKSIHRYPSRPTEKKPDVAPTT